MAFVYLALGVLGIVALGVIMTHRAGLKILAFVIGIAAGLIQIQVGGVHAYTILIFLYIVISPEVRRGVLTRSVLLVLVASLVSVTVLWGDLITSYNLAAQLIVMAVTTALFLARSRDSDLLVAQYGLVVLVTVGAATAIGQVLGIVPEQLFRLEGAETHRPSGIYPEPDWLGLYSAVGLVLVWSFKLRSRIRIPVIGILLLGVLLASARAAIIALIVVVILRLLLTLLTRHRHRHRHRDRPDRSVKRSSIVLVVVLSATLLVFAIAFPMMLDLVTARLAGLLPGSGDAVVTARLGQSSGILKFAEQAPWYGHGLSASGRINGFGAIQYSRSEGLGTTSSNWLAGLWADAKILSLPLIAFLSFSIFRQPSSPGAALLVLILVNSLASNALFFPLTWFAIALCLTGDSRRSEKAFDVVDVHRIRGGSTRRNMNRVI